MKKFLISLTLLLLSTPLFATLATPVTISGVTVASGVATVTTSAVHNISSTDPGFCILSSSVGVDNICGTAATVPTTTTFTVNSATMTACASSCGTAAPSSVFMLKGSSPQFGEQNVSACMWVFVSSGIPISGGTSGCSAQLPTSLQSEVNGAIAAGTWVEYQSTASFANSATLGTIEQYFQALQFSYQLQAIAPGSMSGHSCDVTGCA